MRRVAFTQETHYFVCRKRRPRWSVLMFLVVFCLWGQHHLDRSLLDATVFLLFCLFPHKCTHHGQIQQLGVLKLFLILIHHTLLSVFISFICFCSLSRLPTCFNAVNTEVGRVGSVCVYCTVCKCSSLQSHAFRYSSTKKKKSPKSIFWDLNVTQLNLKVVQFNGVFAPVLLTNSWIGDLS